MEETKMMVQSQIITLKDKDIEIECGKGIVWITFTNGDDVILKENQRVLLHQKGKICITALSDATINLHRNDHVFLNMFHPRSNAVSQAS